jgi:penicillin-binding protein 1A
MPWRIRLTAHRVGITGNIDPYPTMSIGTSALTLIDISTGYATFANAGKLAHPYAVLEIRKPSGELLYSHAANEKDAPQVADPDKVGELNSMMLDVVERGTATRARLGYAPAVGKTGTNAAYRDAWFIGFTAHNVTGVWVGNDDNTPMEGTKPNAVTGGRIPGPAWKRIMDVAEEGLTPEGLPGVPMDGTFAPVAKAPELSALIADEAASPDLVLPDGQDAATKDVLNSMFDLFQNNEPTPVALSKPLKPAAAKSIRQRPLVLPKPNTSAQKKRNSLDRLFGIKKRPEQKPKTIFGF